MKALSNSWQWPGKEGSHEDRDIEALASAYERISKRKIKLELIKPTIPYVEGSPAHARWTLLFDHAKKGAKALEYLADRGNPQTLRNAVRRGFVAIGKPAAKKNAGLKKKTSRYPKTAKSKWN